MSTKIDKHNLLMKLNTAMDNYHENNERLDYCGAWCNNDVLNRMLTTPTKNEACKHLRSLIEFKIFKYSYDGVNFKDSIECVNIVKDLKNVNVYIHELLDEEE